jgi:RNA polymerase sigma-32 factor
VTYYAYRVSELGPYRVNPMEHYGLAVKIARSSPCPPHLTRDDLVQEALAMLCAAARTYDPSHGATFSTWAGSLIRNHLSGVYALYRRVGSVGGRNRQYLSRSLRKYMKGVEPSFDPAVLRPLLSENRHWANATDHDCGVVAEVMLHDDLSLDETWDHRDGEDSPSAKVPLVEKVPDDTSGLPYRDMEEGSDATAVVRKALAWMTVREREICHRRVLDPEGGPTLEELGVEWGVTRQRVQQIEAGTLEKMKRAFHLVHGRKGGHGHPPPAQGEPQGPCS